MPRVSHERLSSRAQCMPSPVWGLIGTYCSILDLKIGTRQHGEHEPPSKIASKTAKCLSTTSASLGLRLCGMQVTPTPILARAEIAPF